MLKFELLMNKFLTNNNNLFIKKEKDKSNKS